MHSLNGIAPKSNNGNGINGGEIFIHRTKCSGNFTIIQNAILEDTRLGAVALAVLLYLLHRPPDWRVRYVEVMARLHIGREAFRRGWNELIAAGYVTTRQGRREDGRIGEFEIYVSDVPVNQGSAPLYGFPVSGKPVSGEPVGGNRPLLSTDTVRTDRQNTDGEKASTGIQIKGPVEDRGPESSTGPKMNGSGPRSTDIVFEHGALKISRQVFADMGRAYKYLPNLESEIYSRAEWANERAAQNGGDALGPLLAVLNKADREAALEQQKRERGRTQDIESW
jgi:hypothetical protein